MSDEVVVEITESQVVEVLLAEGPRGLQGVQGATGLTGADSTVVGPQGVQGETGPAVDTTTLSVEQAQVAGLVDGLAGKAGLTGNTFTVGQVINLGSASTVGAVIRGAAGQTANLQQWQDQNGQPLTNINSFGQLRIRSNSTGDYGALIGASYSANVPLVVKGAAGQTANLQEWQDSSGTVKARVKSTGDIEAPGVVSLWQLKSSAGSSSTVAAIVKGAPSQTANLQEWQDSSGSVVSRVLANGGLSTEGNKLFVGPSATSIAGARINVQTAGASDTAIAIRGAAGQTADLQEWQNSAGTAVAKVDATGTLTAANFLQGTGSPLGVVSANVGAIYVDTASTMGASQWQKMSGTGTSGWVVTVGDTGLRSVTSPSGAISGSYTKVQRIGSMVSLSINISLADSTPSTTIWAFAAGFLPHNSALYEYQSRRYGASGGTLNFVVNGTSIGTSGAFSGAGGNVNFSYVYMTRDPWPASLPGTAA
jgi:hypothetical protein